MTEIFEPLDTYNWLAMTEYGSVFASAGIGPSHRFVDILQGISDRQLPLPKGRWQVRFKFRGQQPVVARLEHRGDTFNWKASEAKTFTIELGLDREDSIQFSHKPAEISWGCIPS